MMVSHEAMVSEKLWNQGNILSGIIKCPVCGSDIYGNVNHKKHLDGRYYRDYFTIRANTELMEMVMSVCIFISSCNILRNNAAGFVNT